MATDKDILENIGRRAAEERRSLGLTQEQLANQLNLNVQYLQRIEAGLQNMTIHSLNRLANALNVQIAILFEPASTPKASPGRPKKQS